MTIEQLEKLEEHLKIDNFKTNKSVNNEFLRELKFIHEKGEDYIRRGKSGGWRDYFTEDQAKEVQMWVAKKEEDIGIKFKI